jgi:hypothetical protein
MIKGVLLKFGYTQNDFCEWGSEYGPSLRDFWHDIIRVDYTTGEYEHYCRNCDWAGFD